MADERKCYAGDLGSDALGKVVRLTLLGSKVVELVLVDITHRVELPGKRTLLRSEDDFRRHHSYNIPADSVVEVLPAPVNPPVPEGLCGVGSCVFIAGHIGIHSWGNVVDSCDEIRWGDEHASRCKLAYGHVGPHQREKGSEVTS